jgi:hypothetical protein
MDLVKEPEWEDGVSNITLCFRKRPPRHDDGVKA